MAKSLTGEALPNMRPARLVPDDGPRGIADGGDMRSNGKPATLRRGRMASQAAR